MDKIPRTVVLDDVTPLGPFSHSHGNKMFIVFAVFSGFENRDLVTFDFLDLQGTFLVLILDYHRSFINLVLGMLINQLAIRGSINPY